MVRPRRRPHPRSLDALFPKPKKPPVRLCRRGHRLGERNWKLKHCPKCRAEDLEAERAADAVAEREEWSRRLNTGPVLTHLIVSTGRIVRNVIPRGLQKRRPAGRARLRRRR